MKKKQNLTKRWGCDKEKNNSRDEVRKRNRGKTSNEVKEKKKKLLRSGQPISKKPGRVLKVSRKGRKGGDLVTKEKTINKLIKPEENSHHERVTP